MGQQVCADLVEPHDGRVADYLRDVCLGALHHGVALGFASVETGRGLAQPFQGREAFSSCHQRRPRRAGPSRAKCPSSSSSATRTSQLLGADAERHGGLVEEQATTRGPQRGQEGLGGLRAPRRPPAEVLGPGRP